MDITISSYSSFRTTTAFILVAGLQALRGTQYLPFLPGLEPQLIERLSCHLGEDSISVERL